MNIYILSDILMTKVSEQNNNTQWIYDLLKRPITRATDNKFPIIRGMEGSAQYDFKREAFFKLSPKAAEFNPIETQLFFDESNVTEQSIQLLKDNFSTDDILICYELSELTRKVFTRAGLRYIDFWLHPVRFIDDVLFAFNSSIRQVNDAISRFDVNESIFYSYADRLTVQNYKGFKRIKDVVKPNSALFIGQTLTDKAIYCDGKMLTLLDFQDQFTALTKKYDHVYYSRHPFVKSGDEAILSFIKKFKNVSVCKTPAYQMLASEEIKEVATISSSVAIESKYFDKQYTYFFKPVVNIEANNTKQPRYYSIYHDFLQANFWSQILGGCIHTVSIPKEGFMETGDKLRDALSFYWGYRDIDKVESLKKTVGTLFQKKNSNIKENRQTLESKIQAASVVSFDIFDTLITRNVISPRDIFTHLNAPVRSISRGNIKNFRQIRIRSEKMAMEQAKENGKQDVSFDEIYDALQAITDIDDATLNEIKECEIKAELAAVQPKQFGLDIFRYCKTLGKDIILISDMYLPREVILSLIKSQGITEDDFHHLFLSCEHGARKTEGDLFTIAIDTLGIKRQELLHIGDNLVGDIETPKSMSIQTHHTPRAAKLFEDTNKATKQALSHFKQAKCFETSSMLSLIASRFYEETSQHDGLFNHDTYRLGYMGLGPLLFSFCTWLEKSAKSKGIENLFFLSRDGKILKDVFDTINSNRDSGITTHYIQSSRRVSKLANIESVSDIWTACSSAIYSTTVKQWFDANFKYNIQTLPLSTFRIHGFTGPDQTIGNKTNRENLYALALCVKEELLDTCAQIRDDYNDYLRRHGLHDGMAGIVDIGYAGTMQEYFESHLNPDIQGFYLGTFDTIFSKSGLNANNTHGYLTHLTPDNDESNTLCTHRFVYEALLCAPDDSFIHTTKTSDGQFTHTFKESSEDDVRQSIVHDIHSGAVSFAQEYYEWINGKIDDLYFEPRNARAILDSFLIQPDKADAALLCGVIFDDSFGPQNTRYIIPPASKIGKIRNQFVVWKAGYRAITEQNHDLVSQTQPGKQKRTPVRNSLIKTEGLIIRKTLGKRKAKKHSRDRKAFFADAKSPVFRYYGSLIG